MQLSSRSVHTPTWLSVLISLLLGSRIAAALALRVDDPASIKHAASIAARDLLKYYNGSQPDSLTPGLLTYPPYFWWESGAMWMTLIEYWSYTGDDQYNDIITQGIQSQTGPFQNFILAAQSFDNGNDDQAFWAFAAMDAAELMFPNPPAHQPQWLALAQAVFNIQLTRFTNVCGGGLPWQVYDTTPGYYYKNSISNGCFFALAARLARYTGNETYAHYANTTWNWVQRSGLISESFQIFDGADSIGNCQLINGIQWTYNAGVFLNGAATMWNHTRETYWVDRINGILDNFEQVFFQHGVMFEQYCEGSDTHPCDTDQMSFKGYTARWMAVCAQLAPWTYPRIMRLLSASARAAAAQCTGGTSGTECGLQWTINGTTGFFDNNIGPGQQIAALSAFGSMMIRHNSTVAAPITHVKGISKGNPGAGLGNTGTNTKNPLVFNPDRLHVTTSDGGAAWFLTALLGLLCIGGGIWMIWEDGKPFTYVSRGLHISSLKTAESEKASEKPSEKTSEKAAEKVTLPARVASSVSSTKNKSARMLSGGLFTPPSRASGRTTPRRSRQPPSSPTNGRSHSPIDETTATS